MKLHVCPRCENRWSEGGLYIDMDGCRALWRGGDVSLPPVAARMMSTLVRAYGRVVRYGALAEAVWTGTDTWPEDEGGAVRTSVCRLKKCLRRARFPGDIRNVRGHGYELILSAPMRAAA